MKRYLRKMTAAVLAAAMLLGTPAHVFAEENAFGEEGLTGMLAEAEEAAVPEEAEEAAAPEETEEAAALEETEEAVPGEAGDLFAEEAAADAGAAFEYDEAAKEAPQEGGFAAGDVSAARDDGTCGKGDVFFIDFMEDENGVHVIGSSLSEEELAGVLDGREYLEPEYATYLQYEITWGQTEARQMLDLVNDFRTRGDAWLWNEDNYTKTYNIYRSPLTYDYELEATAMVRAAENAIRTGHTRPDGSYCYSAFPSGYVTAGENAAWGYYDYIDAFDGWKEEYEYYGGQGHRRNMLDARYNTIGIGHAIRNGKDYWTQAFSAQYFDTSWRSPADYTEVVTVRADSSYIYDISVRMPSDYSMAIGASFDLMEDRLYPCLSYSYSGMYSYGEKIEVPYTDVYLESDDESVVRVSGTKITTVGAGTATIRGYADWNGTRYSNSMEVRVYPTGITNSDVKISFPKYTYNGKQRTLKPTITHNGKTLKEGTDYKLSNNTGTNAGSVSVYIEGIGNYSGSLWKYVSIDPVPAEKLTVTAKNKTYTGGSQLPGITVKYGTLTLKNGTDYTYGDSWRDYKVDIGTYKVTVYFKGNYSGSKEVSWKITGITLKDSDVTGIKASYPYDTDGNKPVPTVKSGTTKLKEGTDYTVSYANNTKVGTATVTVKGKGKYTGTVKKTFKITNPVMYRLYNPNSGEHFYTGRAAERDYLDRIGWNYEGVGWVAPVTSKTPVFRLYNKNAGDHHYTMNPDEKDMLVRLGWKYEGIGWYSDDKKRVPLYRQYNPNARAGSHNYTTNKRENDYLASIGWRAEGIAWYAVAKK